MTDAPIDLGHYTFEAWIAFGFFWLLGADVFYQFFTRYVLNDSAAWTEEIARYLLICMVFVGMSAAVRTSRHIHVDFLYRLIPRRGRARAVDAGRRRAGRFLRLRDGADVADDGKDGNYKMTIIDLPMNLVYGVCMFGFACVRCAPSRSPCLTGAAGYSVLERPEIADEVAR